MNEDIKHIAIAEIYRAVDKIRDFTTTLINASEAEKHSIIMYCDYIYKQNYFGNKDNMDTYIANMKAINL